MSRPLTRTLLAAALAAPATGAFAADHLDAPGVQGNGQSDINDLYGRPSRRRRAARLAVGPQPRRSDALQ